MCCCCCYSHRFSFPTATPAPILPIALAGWRSHAAWLSLSRWMYTHTPHAAPSLPQDAQYAERHKRIRHVIVSPLRLYARLMGVAREKMGKDGEEEEEEVSSSTYNHPWGKSGRLKGKKKKASTSSCVCVWRWWPPCSRWLNSARFFKKTHWATTTTKNTVRPSVGLTKCQWKTSRWLIF